MKGQAVVVTGGAQGIGFAIAAGAARAGAESVLVVGRDAEKAASAARAIEREGAVGAFMAGDLVDPATPGRVFDYALERFGRVDALVNAAGLTDRGSVANSRSCFVGPALRCECAGAVLFDAAVGQSFARSARSWGHRQHSFHAFAWRNPVIGRLRINQGGARRSDQERGARSSLRPHPRQCDQCWLGRHAGGARNAGNQAQQRTALARRGFGKPAVWTTYDIGRRCAPRPISLVLGVGRDDGRCDRSRAIRRRRVGLKAACIA